MNQSKSSDTATSETGDKKRAYATVISTDDYVLAVLQVARRLRECGSVYPMVAFASVKVSDAAVEKLQSSSINVIRFKGPITLPPSLASANQAGGMAHWSHTFDKLQLFDQVAFEKLVYLDSDILVLDNLDDLFERPNMSAVASGRTLRPDWKDLNSGVLVIEPGMVSTAELVSQIEKTRQRLQASGVSRFGDQDVLHTAFPDWPTRTELHLGEECNLFFSDLQECVSRFGFALAGDSRTTAIRVRVVHFAGPRKPWYLRYWVGDFVRSINPLQPKMANARVLAKFAKVYLAVWRVAHG